MSGCATDFEHADSADDIEIEQGNIVEMKIVLGYAEAIPSKDNLVIQELNKLANANILVEWTPMVSYNDKFNVLMSSNNMPDVILVPDAKIQHLFLVLMQGCSGSLPPF